MKANLIVGGIIFLLISCKKTNEFETTTVQIKSVDYYTGDSVGNVSFEIKEPYTASAYGIIDATNAYGNYLGSFEHPADKLFELYASSDLYVVTPAVIIEQGEHNIINIELVELSTLTVDLDCSGSGYIQYVFGNRLVPFNTGSPFYNANEGTTKSYNSGCGYNQPNYEIFSGEWIISYQWSPSQWGNYTNKYDTITIQPGENYVHTIVY